MKILWKLLLARIRERNETCNTLPDMFYKQRPARQDDQDLTCDESISQRCRLQISFEIYYTVLKTQVHDVKTTFKVQ